MALTGSAERLEAQATQGTVTLHVSSVPELKAGERAVFFLDAASSTVDAPHLKGLGILKLDSNNHVAGSSLSLDNIKDMIHSAAR